MTFSLIHSEAILDRKSKHMVNNFERAENYGIKSSPPLMADNRNFPRLYVLFFVV